MKIKKIKELSLLATILLLSTIITGCIPPPVQETQELNIGFVMQPNTQPVQNPEYTIPNAGIHTFNKNEEVLLRASSNTGNHIFKEWQILHIQNGHITIEPIYSPQHTLVMDKDYTIQAVFGCANNRACAPNHTCNTENECVLETPTNTLDYFYASIPDNGSIQNVQLTGTILSTIANYNNYTFNNHIVKLFSEVNAQELSENVLLAVKDNKATIIIGTSVSIKTHKEFTQDLFNAITASGISKENTIKAFSTEVTSPDAHNLFNLDSSKIFRFEDALDNNNYTKTNYWYSQNDVRNFEIETEEKYMAMSEVITPLYTLEEFKLDLANQLNYLDNTSDEFKLTFYSEGYAILTLKQTHNFQHYMNLAFWLTEENEFTVIGFDEVYNVNEDNITYPEQNFNLINDLIAINQPNTQFMQQLQQIIQEQNITKRNVATKSDNREYNPNIFSTKNI
ncbi:MAG: hypothetical protein ACLFN8_05600 [Candidatus Woesearchaeota archaeon]